MSINDENMGRKVQRRVRDASRRAKKSIAESSAVAEVKKRTAQGGSTVRDGYERSGAEKFVKPALKKISRAGSSAVETANR